MTDSSEASPESGSWWPFLLILSLLLARWLSYGEGATPVQFRRWYTKQVRLYFTNFTMLYSRWFLVKNQEDSKGNPSFTACLHT